jgi:PKD repeat protein
MPSPLNSQRSESRCGPPIPFEEEGHVMPTLRDIRQYLPTALVIAILTACVAPTVAVAETYGQLSRFGASGTSHGDFDIRTGDNAFGVDPTDNSVYVGDEPGAKKGEYRIQKLTASGTYVAATALLKPPNHDGIEGIAVDPVEKRIYVLALEKRSEAAAVDAEIPAAGTLYAFSTEPSGETLVPAPGTNPEGVLTGPSTLEPQSEVPERALLEPKGITVDPTTHDVIVLGEIYRAVEKGSGESPTRVVLQRILPNGDLGERYVDTTEFFGPEAVPNSPVVSPAGAVYVAIVQPQVYEEAGTEREADELAQIPSEFSSTEPPTPFGRFTLEGLGEDEFPVVEFDESESPKSGDGLSFTTEGPQGQSALYAKVGVFVHTGETTGAFYPGALTLDGATGSELGWTGGQTATPEKSCEASFGGTTYSSVAAGGKGRLFMFNPASQADPASEVVVFGPGGTGCPTARASEPSAEVDGKPLSPSQTVSAGVPVTFSSKITQANALSVEWSFGDGQTATESADEYQHTAVTHAFVRGGELTVTETIHTDDLATPILVEQTKISVSVTAPPPTAVLEGPTEVSLGETELERLVYLPDGGLSVETSSQDGKASFDASASTASTVTGANRITAYHWVFGDGESVSTETPTVEHKYTTAGVYRVELTVTDAFGRTSEPVTLTIKVKETPPPPPKETASTGTPSVTSPPATASIQTTATTSNHGPPPVPNARLASTSLVVSTSGAVNLDVTCPAGESTCTGTVTLRTLGAVASHSIGARSKKKSKATVLTLAKGSFTVAGGHQRSLTLHLTARARSLLSSAHVLHARATLASHDPAGATHITQTDVILLAPEGPRHHD